MMTHNYSKKSKLINFAKVVYAVPKPPLSRLPAYGVQ
jgi:hypothetical protein